MQNFIRLSEKFWCAVTQQCLILTALTDIVNMNTLNINTCSPEKRDGESEYTQLADLFKAEIGVSPKWISLNSVNSTNHEESENGMVASAIGCRAPCTLPMEFAQWPIYTDKFRIRISLPRPNFLHFHAVFRKIRPVGLKDACVPQTEKI